MSQIFPTKKRIQITVDFIQILINKNFINDKPIKKQEICELYKTSDIFKGNKTNFYVIFQMMFYIKFIKKCDKKYPFYITFDLNRVSDITNLERMKKLNLLLMQNEINSDINKTANVTKENRKKTHKQFEEKCEICDETFQNKNLYNKHSAGISHILRNRYRTNKKELLTDNIDFHFEITNNSKEYLNYSKIVSKKNVKDNFLCKITNRNKNIIYEITDIILLYTKLNEVNLNFKLPFLLQSKQSFLFSVKTFFHEDGCYLLPIIFKISNNSVKNMKPIYLLKELIFYVESVKSNEVLAEPSVSAVKNVSRVDDQIIDGVRPPKCHLYDLQYHRRLASYNLPMQMVNLIECGLKMDACLTHEEQQMLRELRQLLSVDDKNNCFTHKNYCQLLKTLLQFEEYQMKKDIRSYDCFNQKMTTVPTPEGKPKLLALEVPGLAECRPSLIKGDDLMVQIPGDSFKYKGYIHSVKKTVVELGFFERFVENHQDSLLYNVSFGFNRHTLRTEHQAVDLVKKHNIAHFFFPQKPPDSSPVTNITFDWFQPCIGNNPEQQQAVRHIFSGTARPFPYLLFGPPGTGKTMTLVEAILQIWKLKKKSRILVATPSNSAANEITSRLIKNVPKSDLFRMISTSFSGENIPESIKSYCNYKNGEYFYPQIETLEDFRIIIVTLTTSAKLISGNVIPGHFTHIFIDESGHSTETEVLIPIAGIISCEENPGRLLGEIVLAGDPEQLGPIIHSKLAKDYGFEKSMLERLMKNYKVYKKGKRGYNPNLVTKLLKNFRSHPNILHLPNKQFYDGELKSEGNQMINIGLSFKDLPNKKFPLVFHSVKGKDRQDSNSPSYYNREEINVVTDYLEKLVGKRLSGKEIVGSDIGIVSPYRKQVQKLQDYCRKSPWNDVLVGSVEQFQGQEKLIILISTVRSSDNNKDNDEEKKYKDCKFRLGFLKNPKRFNVAITRAIALVVVVGNPDVLMWDKHWGQFIEYCLNNGAIRGEHFHFERLWETYSEDLNCYSIQNESSQSEHADFSRGNI